MNFNTFQKLLDKNVILGQFIRKQQCMGISSLFVFSINFRSNIVLNTEMMTLMPWSHLCVKPPRMSNVRQI